MPSYREQWHVRLQSLHRLFQSEGVFEALKKGRLDAGTYRAGRLELVVVRIHRVAARVT